MEWPLPGWGDHGDIRSNNVSSAPQTSTASRRGGLERACCLRRQRWLSAPKSSLRQKTATKHLLDLVIMEIPRTSCLGASKATRPWRALAPAVAFTSGRHRSALTLLHLIPFRVQSGIRLVHCWHSRAAGAQISLLGTPDGASESPEP